MTTQKIIKHKKRKNQRCSFCLKIEDRNMVAGQLYNKRKAYICERCIGICAMTILMGKVNDTGNQ